MKTHCRNGHPYTPDNVYKNGSGNYRCKKCKKAYVDKLLDDEYEKYERRREYIREWQRTHKRQRAKRIQEVMDFVRTCRTYCVYCGENHPACLDLHHKDPSTKEFPLTKAHIGNRSWESIRAEVAKCEVVCSNCHRKLHYS